MNHNGHSPKNERFQFHQMTISILRSTVESQQQIIAQARHDASSQDVTIECKNKIIHNCQQTIESYTQANRQLQTQLSQSTAHVNKLRECNAALVKQIAELVTMSMETPLDSKSLYRQILTIAMEKNSSENVKSVIVENDLTHQVESQTLNPEDMIPQTVDIQPNETDGLNNPLYAGVTDKRKVLWAAGITPRVSHIAESD
jgi:predicted RNase H-like nuclease (RuvC/YqgF family)